MTILPVESLFVPCAKTEPQRTHESVRVVVCGQMGEPARDARRHHQVWILAQD